MGGSGVSAALRHLRLFKPSPKLFFIGFNKCGTTSFHKFFKANGYLSAHSRAWLLPGFRSRSIARLWAENIASGASPLRGVAHYRVFSGLSYASDDEVIEGNACFRALHAACPDAYFVLNTRPVEAWVQSRIKHSEGRLLRRHMAARGLSEAEVVAAWRSERESFEAEVRQHFAGSERFLAFDISTDQISSLTRFLARDFVLDEKHWRHLNQTAGR
jgi:Sulfotransferase domain